MANQQTVNYPTPNATSATAPDGRLTVSSSAVLCSTATGYSANADTKFIIWDVQDNDVMVTFDGSTPTSTNGHRLYVGDKDMWHIDTFRKATVIRAGSADGTMHFSQFTY